MSGQQESTQGKTSPEGEAIWPLGVILVAVVLVWCGYWLWLIAFIPVSGNVAEAQAARGQFGDMFGAINALFSGLAFAVLIYTMWLQRTELRLQRQELQETREELKRSADAQEQSKAALLQQVEAMQRFAEAGAAQSRAMDRMATSADPHVIVYVKGDDTRPSFILLVIENVGRGLARDVRFTCSDSIPHRVFDGMKCGQYQNMTSGPLIEGIPALGPGDQRRIVWGQYNGLSDAIGSRDIRVTCEFTDGTRKLPPVECVLEVKSLSLDDVVDPDGARQSAKQLERIADSVQDFLRR